MSIHGHQTKVVYDGYAVTATTDYVYNDSGETVTATGWIQSNYDDIVVQIAVATLTATTFYYRIEGKYDELGRAAEIYSGSATAAMTVDELINVTEKLHDIRIGVKVNNAATPNVVYGGVIMSERN